MGNRITNAVSQEEQDLIERFINAYNSIDRYLRNHLNKGQEVSFSRLVKDYSVKNPRWRDREQLQILAELRNVLVHQREGMYQYLSIPTPAVVTSIERIRDEFLKPELVLPRFQTQVTKFSTKDSLSHVLKIINNKAFSQFPVYEDRKFVGLLTENGITRWLAAHVQNVLTLIEFDEILIGEVLKQEEQRNNYEFVNRNCTLREAENRFSLNPSLEAVFITHTGKKDEKLLGIITLWDLLNL